MNVLIIGSGKGSFEMRGQQLGAALGARVTSAPSDDDLRWASVVVLIKKTAVQWAPLVHRFGKPLIWDALDCWQQPGQNGFTRDEALALMAQQHAFIQPTLTIAATQAMAADIGGVYLPHHHRLGLRPAPIREAVQVVAYEGCERYLGAWRLALEQICAVRGWQFVINPADLTQADLIVAFRDGPWDGWMCRQWKSGVKYVNALAAGRPILGHACAAAGEIPSVNMSLWSIDDLSAMLAFMAEYEMRLGAWRVGREHASAYDVEAIARQYRQIVAGVEASCAA